MNSKNRLLSEKNLANIEYDLANERHLRTTIDEWDNIGKLRCLYHNDEIVIGYLNWIIKEDTLEIADLFIHNPKHRQLGIGSILIKAVLKVAKEKKVNEVWGITQWDDYRVHDFYKKHGFAFADEVIDGSLRFSQNVNF